MGVGERSRSLGRILAPATRLLPPPSRRTTEVEGGLGVFASLFVVVLARPLRVGQGVSPANFVDDGTGRVRLGRHADRLLAVAATPRDGAPGESICGSPKTRRQEPPRVFHGGERRSTPSHPPSNPAEARAHPGYLQRRRRKRVRVGEGGRRTLAEPWAYPRPGDATFAAPEPANHVNRMGARLHPAHVERWQALPADDHFAPNLYAAFFGSKSASVKPLLIFTFM